MRLIREELKSVRECIAESDRVGANEQETRELRQACSSLAEVCELLLAKADKQQTRIKRLQREMDALR